MYRVSEAVKDELFERSRLSLKGIGVYDEDLIEEEKRSGDPMYHLLFFPYMVYGLPNGHSCSYIDRVLFTAIDICKRRVGISLTLNTTNKRVLTRICSPEIRNHKLKMTFLWMLMFVEPVVQDFIKSLYKDPEKKKHFQDVAPFILGAVRHTLLLGFDEFTITKRKNDFYTETLIPTYTIGK